MTLNFILGEIKKWQDLRSQHTDAFLNRLGADEKTREYIDLHVLPVIETDINFQSNYVDKLINNYAEMKNAKYSITNQGN